MLCGVEKHHESTVPLVLRANRRRAGAYSLYIISVSTSFFCWTVKIIPQTILSNLQCSCRLLLHRPNLYLSFFLLNVAAIAVKRAQRGLTRIWFRENVCFENLDSVFHPTRETFRIKFPTQSVVDPTFLVCGLVVTGLR